MFARLLRLPALHFVLIGAALFVATSGAPRRPASAAPARPPIVIPASTIEELRRVMRENLAWRDERHPDLWLYPCVGSIFQKIDGIGAGRLIDECGLKGHVHNGAGIFHKHANIIVNFGGATAADVRTLIDLARDTVAREHGYELVPEITFVGEF